jgi:hypothetical protein
MCKGVNTSPKPGVTIPPLPATVALAQPTLAAQPLQQIDPGTFPHLHIRSLRCGSYLINYSPTGSVLISYDGTVRVECHSSGRTASGDLYQRKTFKMPPISRVPPRPGRIVLGPPPNPADGIPVLPRNAYRYYLRVTTILEYYTTSNSFTLGFEMYRFNSGAWNNEGAFTALLTWVAAPAGYPSSGDYLTGDVKNSSGAIVGKLSMGWVSKYLRKATVEIDRVAASESPLDNGSGVNWKAVGDSIDWEITALSSNADVTEPSGESWSDAECHSTMLTRRDTSDLDSEWRYHILCVRRLDSTERGIMYDAYASDSNNVPREGCAISSHWVVPNASPWGKIKGARFGTATGPYFRTAIHETGHAMGLYHNTVDYGYMNTTDVIATAAPTTFPDNVQWAYAADDQKRLRHMPDVYVRPGGLPFGTSYAATPISPTDFTAEAEGLAVTVSPLLEFVPLGAPVRVTLNLTNIGDAPAFAPASVSMASGFVKGTVSGPNGVERTFTPLVLCVDHTPMKILQPGKSVTNSLTLLRGGQGALFPTPGVYRITVDVRWDSDEMEFVTSGETTVIVTPAFDSDHAQAAYKVLASPDALLTMVLGGDHLADGIDTIHSALKNPVLRPHFAYVEAKRLSTRFGKRKADLKTAADLMDDSTVMSPAEIKKMAVLVKDAGTTSVGAKSIATTLKERMNRDDLNDEIKSMVKSL